MNPIERLRSRMSEHSIPALLVNDIGNVQWMTGFTGSFGFVLLTPSGGCFLTDARYTLQAEEQVKDLQVVSYASPKKVEEVLAEQAAKLGVSVLRFEPSTTYLTLERWKNSMAGIEFLPAPETLIQSLRMIKTAEEAEKVQAACKLADACLHHVVRLLQPGVSEYDIGLEIEFFFRRNKADVGFSPIVASGPNSARPHHRAGERKIEWGDFVTLDLGCTLDGYNSDITRTFIIGEASERHREVYNQVLKAEVETCAMMVPGANGKDVDARAREILDEKDMAQYFGHSLGHGLGRSVHDFGRLHMSTDQPIEAGQIWTIEPGVYSEGFGGVRIEDDVLVTDGEPRILTSYPKELTIL